jgi:hypothetical protein
MFKKIVTGATMLALIAAGAVHAQTTTITTGAASNSDVGGYSLDSNDWIDGQINLSGAQTITSIQAYLDDPVGGAGDQFNITLYADNGSNKLGTELFSGTATWSATGWNGLSNLNWAVAGGNYWVGLEISDAQQTSFVATTGAPTLLANTAFSANGGANYTYRNISGTGLSKDLNFGLAVTAVAAVPEADGWLMLLLGLGTVAYVWNRRSRHVSANDVAVA